MMNEPRIGIPISSIKPHTCASLTGDGLQACRDFRHTPEIATTRHFPQVVRFVKIFRPTDRSTFLSIFSASSSFPRRVRLMLGLYAAVEKRELMAMVDFRASLMHTIQRIKSESAVADCDESER